MGDREWKCEASGESSRLLGKKNELLALGSLHSGGISRQYPESGPSTSTQNVPVQEQRIEVGFDLTSFTRFQMHSPRVFEVAARGDDKALSNLLTNCTTEIQSIDSKGNTALHYAVTSACHKGDCEESLYQCIDLLMSCEQMKVNMPNKNGYTAIGLAVHHLHRTCIEHILKNPSVDRLHLDYCPGDRESTVREIIIDIYPELQPLLPAPLMESLESPNIDEKLLAALQHNKYEEFLKYLSPTNPDPWYDEPYHSSLLEIACQMKNRQLFVTFLLDHHSDPNITNRVTGMPLIHATARSGNFEVLQLLLEKEVIDISLKDHEERKILHWLAGVNEGKSGDKEKIEKCLKLLLDSNYNQKTDIDDTDSLGNTALYITVESEYRDRAKLLLSKGADVRVFERGSKILLSDSVSIVKEILDDCLQSNDKPLNSKDLQLKLKYQSIMNIVHHMAESKFHRELLTHPVMSALLAIKWENVRYVFFLNMLFYIIFLCFLTAYILCSDIYKTLNDEGAASNTPDPFSFNNGNITSGIYDRNFTSQTNSSSLLVMQNFLMISLFLLILRGILQLHLLQWVYINSLENWLEILLIISTFISCSGWAEGVVLKRHFSAVALLLGWSELLILTGRLPLLSVHYEMLKTVIFTFLWYMMGYVTLLIAFALSFHILFKGSPENGKADMFADPLFSLLKTIFMFTGEFEASDLSFDTLPYTSHVIFLLFVVLVAIVLLNLLNGLAVNDTGEIRKDAEVLSLAARAKLISKIERLVNALQKRNALATFLKPSVEMNEEMFVIYPNRRNRIGSAAVRSLLLIIGERMKFHEKEKSSAFPKDLDMFTEKLTALEYGQKRLEKKLDSMFGDSRKILMQTQAGLGNRECETTGTGFES